MNNINKKAELCSQLNMDFEEANELFEEESLGSLQMARVNGGKLPIGDICAIINCIVGVVSLICKLFCKTTKDPNENTNKQDERFIHEKTNEMVKSGMGGMFMMDSVVDSEVCVIEYHIGVATPIPIN